MSVDTELAAYLAGAMDSDGTIGIRRSTYAVRVTGDSRQPTFSERLCLKQVTPQIPTLLRDTFGGSLMLQSPSAPNGRALHYWEATNAIAAEALRVLLPYLRIKRRQAEICLALRASKDLPRREQRTYREASISRTKHGDTLIRRLELAPHIVMERQRLYESIKALNKVGV